MLILTTNDDGIDAKGLRVLFASLQTLGDVWTVAPDRPRNATGRSLTLHRPLRISKGSARSYRVDGTPSDCVNIGVNEILPRPPDLVVSGINHGSNLADDILYSGTVAAAFEATVLGIPAVAASLAVRSTGNFNPAGRFVLRVARWVLDNGLPSDTLLNVNIPDTKGKPVKRFEVTRQGKSIYSGSVRKCSDPRGDAYYWIGGKHVRFKKIRGTDADALSKHSASITPLTTDITCYQHLESLQSAKL